MEADAQGRPEQGKKQKERLTPGLEALDRLINQFEIEQRKVKQPKIIYLTSDRMIEVLYDLLVLRRPIGTDNLHCSPNLYYRGYQLRTLNTEAWLEIANKQRIGN